MHVSTFIVFTVFTVVGSTLSLQTQKSDRLINDKNQRQIKLNKGDSGKKELIIRDKRKAAQPIFIDQVTFGSEHHLLPLYQKYVAESSKPVPVAQNILAYQNAIIARQNAIYERQRANNLLQQIGKSKISNHLEDDSGPEVEEIEQDETPEVEDEEEAEGEEEEEEYEELEDEPVEEEKPAAKKKKGPVEIIYYSTSKSGPEFQNKEDDDENNFEEEEEFENEVERPAPPKFQATLNKLKDKLVEKIKSPKEKIYVSDLKYEKNVVYTPGHAKKNLKHQPVETKKKKVIIKQPAALPSEKNFKKYRETVAKYHLVPRSHEDFANEECEVF